MIEVYHLTSLYHSCSAWLRDDEELIGMFKDGRYEVVAKVQTDSPEEAYELTQHEIQPDYTSLPWWDNPKVECLSQTRSTDVGDILFDTSTGQHFLVRGFMVKHTEYNEVKI